MVHSLQPSHLDVQAARSGSGHMGQDSEDCEGFHPLEAWPEHQQTGEWVISQCWIVVNDILNDMVSDLDYWYGQW